MSLVTAQTFMSREIKRCWVNTKLCGNGVTKTFGNSVLVRMANFTPTAKRLPMGVIVAKIIVLVKISVFAKDSYVDDCAYILEIVPMIQDHSFAVSCSEDADLLLCRRN